MTRHLDLLVDSLLTLRNRAGQRVKATLLAVLASLARDDVSDFPRLRTHQFAPWVMFLVQLGAIALRRGHRTDMPTSEEDWRRLLLALTDGRREPWCLVVDDLSQPAFFQPPVPEGSLARWNVCEHPDDLDLPVTAKSHDLKASVMRAEMIEAWIYALVTSQTMQGYPGRGYNGISRMKGGYGNRPFVGVTPDHTLSARFRRDVAVLLQLWPELVDGGYRDDGIALTWLEAWDGRTSLAMKELAPHFIEVCGRVRLADTGAGGLRCLYTTTAIRRCLSAISGGGVGDPWIPLARADNGALTVGSGGFHYKLLTALLFEKDYAPAAAQQLRPEDGEAPLFVAIALARGQGKTEGLHEYVLILAPEVRACLAHHETRAAIGTRAVERIERAAKMRSHVLYPALKKLAGRGTPMPDSFDTRVNAIFFDRLFRSLPLSDEEARLAFERDLRDIAIQEIEQAMARTPAASAQRFRTLSEAEGTFYGCLRKHFPNLDASPATAEGISA